MPIPFTIAILSAAAVSALLHIRAEYRGPRWQVYCFKPVTTGLLLVLALVPASTQGLRYQAALGVGLGFSLLGDVFLMLPGDRFVPGLASFLLAHVAYIVAFTSGATLGAAPAALALLLVAAVPVLRLLWPRLDRLRAPVLLYAATILIMAWQAWGRSGQLGGPGPALAAIGATLFMVSDGLLAVNRFYRRLPCSHALIMTTYVAAQALIAASVSVGAAAD